MPGKLLGTPGHDAPVPHELFPVFRDREEPHSSADLGELIHAALAESA
jgi:hypothetical protein